jgi:hypothetical protein
MTNGFPLSDFFTFCDKNVHLGGFDLQLAPKGSTKIKTTNNFNVVNEHNREVTGFDIGGYVSWREKNFDSRPAGGTQICRAYAKCGV